jgi:hypothetical protein
MPCVRTRYPKVEDRRRLSRSRPGETTCHPEDAPPAVPACCSDEPAGADSFEGRSARHPDWSRQPRAHGARLAASTRHVNSLVVTTSSVTPGDARGQDCPS